MQLNNRPSLILHINTAYATTKVHSGLIKSLDNLHIEQFVYAPVRKKNEMGGNKDSSLKHTTYKYSYILRPWHKILFRLKIDQIRRDIERGVELKKVQLTHAHFLYSDGAVSLLLKKRYGIPYIVSIRNADVNSFMKWRQDLRWKRDEILNEASKINFMSPAYKSKLLARLPKDIADSVDSKSTILPNGLEDIWFEELPDSYKKSNKLRLLYVGEFTKNKNVVTLLKAARQLSDDIDIKLTLVGSGGNGETEVDAFLAKPEYSFAVKTGWIEDVIKLREIYRNHDIFVMISKKETFGVTYIEALSQGLPIVHSKGEGIDGYFKDGMISKAVDPYDQNDIKDSILELYNRSDDLRSVCRREAQKFSWDVISKKYVEIYNELIQKQV